MDAIVVLGAAHASAANPPCPDTAAVTLYARNLSDVQAARLAAVLPDPKGRNAAKPSAFVRAHANEIQSGAETIEVDGRAVTHGTPYQYASFCSPPESVTITPALSAPIFLPFGLRPTAISTRS